MLKPAKMMVVGAMLAAGAHAALAADIYEPPVVEMPPPPVYEEVDVGGWYIRGDIDYHWSNFRGADYITYSPPGTGTFDFGDLRGAWSVGGGVGYQVNSYFRTDLTVDWWGKSKFRGQTSGFCGGAPCVSVDETSYSALVLLANAYAELGTYHGITPYVGVGIGGTHLRWDDLRNTVGGTTTVHEGSKEWRFTYALMAGASYCLTQNLMLDAGYRYSRVAGGRMFEFAPVAGPGFDKGIDVHEVRGGVRYQFGGGNPACGPEEVPYEPPVPIYK